MPERHPDLDAIRDWFHADRRRCLTDGQAIEAFHPLSPRCRFIKTLPAGATVLDIGAGEGALHIYRDAHGIPVMTGNYFDDATHRAEIPLARDVLRELGAAGIEVEAWGIVNVPFVDGELASASRTQGDVVGATMAYWSFTEWCQYVVGRR